MTRRAARADIVPIILSGGSGTRLWPLSTAATPKQFLRLLGDKTLFQETVLRSRGLPGLADPIVVCNVAHRRLVAEQLDEIGVGAGAIVLEPAGRNTAPAIAVAALLALRDRASALGSAPETDSAAGADPVLLVLPADHVITDAAAFREAVGAAVGAARAGRLVTFGIVPAHPETGYGYIEQGDSDGDADGQWARVERFVEKPDRATAERYVDSGRYLWNSGMFVFGAGALLAELGRLAPEILAACEQALAGSSVEAGITRLGDAFLASPSDSIDYAVMEKTDRAAVVPLDAGWSDVGSWAALHDVLAKDGEGNALRGNVATLGVSGSLVIAGSRKIAVIGLDDVVVIESKDALLVVTKEASQRVKEAQAKLEAETD